MRCVDCQQKRDDPDHDERMRRIEAAAPPVSAIEGRVQQWRDDKRDDPEYETVWHGGEGLSGYQQRNRQ